jgi:RHS repeat-associated protein
VGEYWYDGDGKRVKKWAYFPNTNETEITIFVYDAAGKQIAEYSTNVAAIEQAEVAYLTNDHLGSPRINTDRDGNVTSRHDYYPFGEEILTAERTTHPNYTPDSVRKQFTGYERDGETGLDFAQARFFNSSMGRFSSPDLFSNDTINSDPQSWNLYVYARNNPLNVVDPTGTKAEIHYSYDKKTNTVTITVKASFSVYGAKGQNVSKADRAEYAKMLKEGIERSLKQEFTDTNGRTYKMSGEITVREDDNERAAKKSGADNIVELGYDNLIGPSGNDAGIAFGVPKESFDRMAISISPGVRADGLGAANYGETFAHEFLAHLMYGRHNGDKSEFESLFADDGGNGRFFQSDFKRLFREHDPFPPPGPGSKPRPNGPAFSNILSTTGSGIERRRAESPQSSAKGVYQWVKRQK